MTATLRLSGWPKSAGLGSLQQLEHVAPPVANELLALARHDDDDRRLGVAGGVNWPAADLADRLLFGAHTVIIGSEAIALQTIRS